MATNQATGENQGPTKTLVWKGNDPDKSRASRLHSRYIEPEHHGVSKTYHFHPDTDHTLEVDAADAAIIMEGPDKAEFRIKASKAEGGE